MSEKVFPWADASAKRAVERMMPSILRCKAKPRPTFRGRHSAPAPESTPFRFFRIFVDGLYWRSMPDPASDRLVASVDPQDSIKWVETGTGIDIRPVRAPDCLGKYYCQPRSTAVWGSAQIPEVREVPDKRACSVSVP